MESLTNKRTLYFAHPWVRKDVSVKFEMIELLEKLGYDVYDPLGDATSAEDARFGGPYYEVPITSERVRYIVERDYLDILKRDVLFAWVLRMHQPKVRSSK